MKYPSSTKVQIINGNLQNSFGATQNLPMVLSTNWTYFTVRYVLVKNKKWAIIKFVDMPRAAICDVLIKCKKFLLAF